VTTDMKLTVFEDFNEPRNEPVNLNVADDPHPSEDTHGEAWTAGFLAGRQERGSDNGERTLTAQLVTSVFAMHKQASTSISAAAIEVANLFIVAVAADNWPVQLGNRLHMVAERIKPALTGTPEYLLWDNRGIEHRFAETSEIIEALSADNNCERVSIRWKRGEATISRSALVEDIRRAIVPLSSGRSNQQHSRNLT
jgi:hypothetical protein